MDIVHLKNLLIKHGIPQTELAAILGRDKSVVTNLFQGRRRLKADEAAKIAERIGVSIAEVMGRIEPPSHGFSEAAVLIPFQYAPKSSRKIAGVVKKGEKFFLEAENNLSKTAYALEMADDSMNLAGIIAGDVIISELNRSFNNESMVVAQHYQKGGAVTIIRYFSTPFLFPRSSNCEFRPLHLEHDDVRIVSPVLKLIRAF